jgi:hypothetical protein
MIGETKIHATARFEDGEASIKVTGVTPYGNRSVSTTVEVTDKKAIAGVEAALKGAIESVGEDLRRKAFGDAARAVTAAFDNEEALEGPRTIVRRDKDGSEKLVKMKEEG